MPAADFPIFSNAARRDDHGRIGEVLNAQSVAERETITYDTQDRVSSTRDMLGNETQYVYDSRSRVQSVTKGRNVGGVWDVSQYVTVEHGRLSEQLETDSTRTVYSYDRAGRVLTINRDADAIGMAQFGDDQRFAWDVLPVGISCPSATDCKNLTGRLALAESTWSAGVLKTFYGYTTQGQVAHETLQTQPGTNFRTGYQFDTAGRLTDIDYPLGTGDSAHYVYAGTGDADNHQVSRLENWFFGGFDRSLVDRVERHGGAISKMWYHQHGAAAIPVNPSVERDFRLDGRLARTRWRSGSNANTSLGDYTYSYQDSGQLAGIDNVEVGGFGLPSAFFTYDSVGRLTCATDTLGADCDAANPHRVARYTYDSRGNRLTSHSRDLANVTHTFNYGPAMGNTNPMRVHSWTRADWNAGLPMNIMWGNGASGFGGPGQRFAEWRNWNGAAEPNVSRISFYYASGRTSQVQTFDGRGGTTSNFSYDHSGRRRMRVQSLPNGDTISELFFYDLQGRNLGAFTTRQTRGVTTTRAEPIFWIENEPVARYVFDVGAWTDISYFYNDQTGTPRLAVKVDLSHLNPQVKYRATTEPFLAGPPSLRPELNGGEVVRLRFPGQWEDNGTDMQWVGGSVSAPMSALVANHARVYEPGFGGYRQGEPLLGYGRIAGVEGITPWFGYAGHQPSEMVDANGAWVVPFLASVAAVGAIVVTRGLIVGYFGANTIFHDAQVNFPETGPASGLPGDQANPASIYANQRFETVVGGAPPIVSAAWPGAASPNDAFRHCVWSCSMTIAGTSLAAHIGGAIHEMSDHALNEDETLQRGQDLCNNATGRSIGSTAENKQDCISRCRSAVLARELVLFPRTNPHDRWRSFEAVESGRW